MPSNALLRWQIDRHLRLNELDAQCTATLALVPARPNLADENLRAFVALLSAHFQGFCRDLYTEATQLVAAAVPLAFVWQFNRSAPLSSSSIPATPTCTT